MQPSALIGTLQDERPVHQGKTLHRKQILAQPCREIVGHLKQLRIAAFKFRNRFHRERFSALRVNFLHQPRARFLADSGKR